MALFKKNCGQCGQLYVIGEDCPCWEKNQTSTPPDQQPVATVTSETGNPDITMSWWHQPALAVGTKLYTTPPKREWVGLTDEEIDELHGSPMNLEHSGELKWVRIIEAKLKEKNYQ